MKDSNNNAGATAPTLRDQVANLAISPQTGLQIQRVGEAWAFSELLARSGMLPKNTTVEGATVAMVAGARLGLDPFQSVQGIASINGRPSIWGDAMLAVCKSSGKLEYIRKEVVTGKNQDDAGIRVTVKRSDEAEPYVDEFTVADAKRAGLWGKAGPWTAYPRRMLYQRARAFALRDAVPEYLKGLRLIEEEQDTPADAGVIDGDVVGAAAPAAAKPARKRPARTIGDLVQTATVAPLPIPEDDGRENAQDAPTEAREAAGEAPAAAPVEEDGDQQLLKEIM